MTSPENPLAITYASFISMGATDVLGPSRIAIPGQEEIKLKDGRLLLLPRAGFLPYASIFDEAELPRLHEDPDFSTPEIKVVAIPNDTLPLGNAVNAHKSQEEMLGRVFTGVGKIIRAIVDTSGKIPSADSLQLRRIIALRRIGKITMLPPVELVESNDELVSGTVGTIAEELNALVGNNPRLQEFLVSKYSEGLNHEHIRRA